MTDEESYQKWIKSRARTEPQNHFAAKTMAQIKSYEVSAPPKRVIAEMTDWTGLESWMIRAGLAIGIFLLGLFRLAYVPYHLLMP
ncbi:MAG: hypothetical protein KJ737_13480 [Proteobacteria bacterium]|nr:hypothetical protein [Pseudomonadota bacterium]